MYRGAGDTISEESSEQDQSIEEIDSGESEVRIWNPALPVQQTRPRTVGGAPQCTTEQERIDHLLQQQYAMAISDDDDELPLLSAQPGQHYSIGYQSDIVDDMSENQQYMDQGTVTPFYLESGKNKNNED